MSGERTPTRKQRQTVKSKGVVQQAPRPRCGLCGKTTKLTKTQCCDQWICDDEDQYIVFSYARNSCQRNHSCYTLCAYHYNEGHQGKWQDCPECRESFETAMYAWYATNEYNLEKLADPPSYQPTHCAKCKRAIRLGEDGYSVIGGEYLCEDCSNREMAALLKRKPQSR